MPFTPFHFGPGAAIKAAVPHLFSLRAFILCQIVIDSEVAWHLARGTKPLHGFFHTYLGVSCAMILTGVLLVCYNHGLKLWHQAWPIRKLENCGKVFLLRPSLIAILVGGLSHVLLDSFMHNDMQPLYPISIGNPLLETISIDRLHEICLASFVAAVVIWYFRELFSQIKRNE